MTKNKKATIYVISGLATLLVVFAVYFFLDFDSDKISRKVNIDSYNSYFDKYVKSEFSKSFNDFSEKEKIEIIKKISGLNNTFLKMVAVRNLSKTGKENFDKDLYSSFLNSSDVRVASEAIDDIKNIDSETAKELLDEFINSKSDLCENPSIYANYDGFSIYGKNDKKKHLKLIEYNNESLNFDETSVYEINLLIPSGPLFFASFPNFDDNWSDFASSKLISKFAKTEAYEDLKKVSLFSDYFRIKNLIDESAGFLSSKAEPDKLFRDDLKFAKYADGNLLVTFAGKNIEMFSKMIELVKLKGKTGYTVTDENFNGFNVTKIGKGSAKNIYFATVSDYFVLSDSRDLINKSIEAFSKDNSKSITFDVSFRSDYEKTDLSGSEDFAFMRIGMDYFTTVANRDMFLLRKAISLAQNLKISIAGTEQIKEKLFNYNPGLEETAKFINDETSALLITNSTDPFRLFVEESMNSEDASFKKLEKKLGINLKQDIFGSFSKTFLLAFSGIDYMRSPSETYATPKLLVVLNLTKPQGIESGLEKLLGELTKRKPAVVYHNGTKISDYSTSAGEGFQLDEKGSKKVCYALFKNFLLFGSNPDILKNALDNYNSGKTNLSIAGFANSDYSKLEIRTGKFLQDYFKYLSKYSTKSTLFNEFEVERKIKPLFDLLQSIGTLEYIAKMDNYSYSGEITLDLNE